MQEYYEEGVRISFSSKGATGADTYLADDTNVPATSFVNPTTERSTDVSSMVSNLTVKWNDNATESKKLERIMVQKWIALFLTGRRHGVRCVVQVIRELLLSVRIVPVVKCLKENLLVV